MIRVIRASKTQAEAKERLMQIKTPAALMKRAFGDEGFAQFQQERGVADDYSLTPVQAEAILKMTLGQLVNLEQEKLADEHAKLLIEIGEYLAILADEQRIYAIIREDCQEVARKHADKRRTEISGEEIGEVNLEDLIEEEPMVVSISHNGYIKRTPVERLPRPAPRRQGHQRGRSRRRRSGRAPLRHQHARLPAVLHATRARSTGKRSTTCRHSAARAKAGRS